MSYHNGHQGCYLAVKIVSNILKKAKVQKFKSEYNSLDVILVLLWLKNIQEHKDAVLCPYSTCLICVLFRLQRFYRFCVLIAHHCCQILRQVSHYVGYSFTNMTLLYRMGQHTRFWFLSHCRTAKAQASLRIYALPRAFATCIYKVWM